MKIVVIGSGLIGVTTAYFLRRRGHEVTVIDREEGPCRQTSFANGALLTPSMADPWNSPGCWRVLLNSLFRSDAALQLRLRALPGMASWGIEFLRNSTVAAFQRNTLANLRLALYSCEVMESLRQQAGIDYGRTALGTLRVFRSPAALDRAVGAADHLRTAGVHFHKLSQAETVELEPALAPITEQLAGAVHYVSDETGDAYRFCTGLAEHARKLGVEFRFGTEVSSLRVRSGQVTAVVSSHGLIAADRYIVAAGSYSTPLLRRIGIDVPVRPAKGYSITLERLRTTTLRIPVVDDDFHAAVVPLEGAIRVAGTAEFCGYDLALRPDRIRNLLRLLQAVLPREQFDLASARPWCGLRPLSADGVPIVGATGIANLSVNTGHGHLGWTMAAGSARLLADLITEDSPSIDPTPYSLHRFSNRKARLASP